MSDSSITITSNGGTVYAGEQATSAYALISAKHMLRAMGVGLKFRNMTKKKVIAQIALLTGVPVKTAEEATRAAEQKIAELRAAIPVVDERSTALRSEQA